jgi:carbon starvation protein
MAILALVFLVLLSLAYFGYGSWISRELKISDKTKTPAHTHEDGVDFVPTSKFYLFGQHFSAIAAAGPIAGPIVACQLFGWLPALLWIAVGVVTVGAVHDFTSLTASVRHGACSVAEIAKENIGRPAGLAMLIFIWIALVYIILAFADITAGSFATSSEELEGLAQDFHPGGAVAAASIFYLILSLVMGFTQRYLKPPTWLLTLIFVPLAFAASYAGIFVSEYFRLDHTSWALIIIIYCALGSLVPVWMLLQPRGFLGGFILYFAIAVGILGVLFGNLPIEAEAFKGWHVEGATGALFPFLFVTIACGACSGFHGIVCSGTTSKQVDKESHMHAVGYGAMLAEAFVAFIALAIVMTAKPESIAGLKPGTIYGNGIGNFITMLVGEEHRLFATTLGAMAFSTFVFDTLDVSTRLGRFILMELLKMQNRSGAIIGTLLTAGVPALFIVFSSEGSWIRFWTLFGAANQMLAALTLLSITLWLYRARKRIAYTLLPMLFVLTITLYALFVLAVDYWKKADGFDVNMANSLASISLIGIAVFINIYALLTFKRKKRAS